MGEICTKANPGRPPEMADFANFCIMTPRGDPVGPRCHEIWGNQVAEGVYNHGTPGYRVGCFAPALMWRGRGVNFGLFLSDSQDGLKQPISAPNSSGIMAGPYLRLREEL